MKRSSSCAFGAEEHMEFAAPVELDKHKVFAISEDELQKHKVFTASEMDDWLCVARLRCMPRVIAFSSFQPTMSIPDFIANYGDMGTLPLERESVSLAGMILKKKETSSTDHFLYVLRSLDPQVHDKLQVVIEARYSNMDQPQLSTFHSSLHRGLMIGVTGFPGKDKGGEISIFAKACVVLPTQPNLNPIGACNPIVPSCTGLEETCQSREIRRNRKIRDIVMTRSKIVRYIESVLLKHNFLKVKIPMMGAGGGPASLPFLTLSCGMTHMCPTLKAWCLQMIGDVEYVYKLAKGFIASKHKVKRFRNEIDLSHLAEFTSCSFYMDFDYNDLMNLTEEIISGMVKDITGGSYIIKCHADGLDKDPIEIDFKPPFRRINMMEELQKKAELTMPDDIGSDATIELLTRACTKHNIECLPSQTTTQLFDKLVKHFLLEGSRRKPIFIMDHPKIISPSVKIHRSKPNLAERFQLFVNKHEICNGYAALIDPLAHHEILCGRKGSNFSSGEAVTSDETPRTVGGSPLRTGGWSFGIDRLTMLLTDWKS